MLKSYLGLFVMTILCLTLFGCTSDKANILLLDGNLNFLKGQKLINVEYNYDNLMVAGMKEDSYLEKVATRKNSDEPGRGDRWIEQWFADRKERFQPKFEESLNEYLFGKAIFRSDLQDTKYSLVLKTIFIEPGTYGSNKNTKIDADCQFVETDNPQNVLATILIDDSHKRGLFDYTVGFRIQLSYELAGQKLASFIIQYF